MVKKKLQLRITVPKWIVDLKDWNDGVQLEVVPLIGDDNKPITRDTLFIIKEIKKDE